MAKAEWPKQSFLILPKAVKRHLWRFLSDCLVEIVSSFSLFERCLLELCMQGNVSLCFIMSWLCWNNMLLPSLVVVVFVCHRCSFRVSERWNCVKKDSELKTVLLWTVRVVLFGEYLGACLLAAQLSAPDPEASWGEQRSMYWNADFH